MSKRRVRGKDGKLREVSRGTVILDRGRYPIRDRKRRGIDWSDDKIDREEKKQ